MPITTPAITLRKFVVLSLLNSPKNCNNWSFVSTLDISKIRCFLAPL